MLERVPFLVNNFPSSISGTLFLGPSPTKKLIFTRHQNRHAGEREKIVLLGFGSIQQQHTRKSLTKSTAKQPPSPPNLISRKKNSQHTSNLERNRFENRGDTMATFRSFWKPSKKLTTPRTISRESQFKVRKQTI